MVSLFLLRIPDNDLRTRRVKQKVDPVTGIIYIKDVYDPEKIVAAVREKKLFIY